MSYRTEFPDFLPADMPSIPPGFADTSWHNDACPSFTSEDLGLVLWIDYRDPAARERSDGPRFVLAFENETLADGDDMQGIVEAVEAHCRREHGGHVDTGRGLCAHCAKVLV